jgi:peroxiredoxin
MGLVLAGKRFLIAGLLTMCVFLGNVFAEGHKIQGSIANYDGTVAFLAMMYGGNEYMIDTTNVLNGNFVFETRYHLQSGVYLVILPPTSSFLILVDDTHTLSFKADIKDINSTIQFEGSVDNTEYYNYLRFFENKRADLDKIKSEYDAQANEADKVELLSKMQGLKNEVVTHQKALVARIPGTLTAAMIKSELPVDVPVYDGSPEEINLKKYLHQKAHFFDNVDIADERLIRAPKNVLVDRVDYYLDNLIPQHPDSLIVAVDDILHKSAKTEVSYRFFLTHMFNKYRDSRSIGMDAIYVHIAENYIAKGKAPWIEEDEKNTVLTAVKNISPTLIGKKAPNFTVQLEEGKDISLYDIESPYTVLFFWAPNCTHCQQSIPVLGNFYNAYKDKGVQVFAVCTKLNEQEKNCWEYLDKNNLHNWINASDKMGGNSAIHTQYNIRTTPKIYILGKDKTIIAKDMGVEHLDEVMKRLLQ